MGRFFFSHFDKDLTGNLKQKKKGTFSLKRGKQNYPKEGRLLNPTNENAKMNTITL